MSSPIPASESPAQKAARERRERREAKIKAGGSARLDKITQLSGRTPESVRTASPPPASPSPSSQSDVPPPLIQVPSTPPPSIQTDDPNIRAQQEAFLRNMMRQTQPDQPQGSEDALIRLFSQFAGVPPSSSDPDSPGAASDTPVISGTDLSAATGIPTFLTNILTGQSPVAATVPESPLWKIIHIIFAVLIGIYLVIALNYSILTYGKDEPPPPAVAQNPIVIFMVGEATLQAGRVLLGQASGGSFGKARRIFKDFTRDAFIVVFILGARGWWNGETV